MLCHFHIRRQCRSPVAALFFTFLTYSRLLNDGPLIEFITCGLIRPPHTHSLTHSLTRSGHLSSVFWLHFIILIAFLSKICSSAISFCCQLVSVWTCVDFLCTLFQDYRHILCHPAPADTSHTMFTSWTRIWFVYSFVLFFFNFSRLIRRLRLSRCRQHLFCGHNAALNAQLALLPNIHHLT